MYSESSFQNYIFWLKVRRVFFMIIFSIIGALVGIGISEFLVNILLFETFFRIVIIAVSTLLFFSISLLITANTGKEIQDGYWKIAVLRKLTVISKKLDVHEDLDIDSLKKEIIEEEKDFKRINEHTENEKAQIENKQIENVSNNIENTLNEEN